MSSNWENFWHLETDHFQNNQILSEQLTLHEELPTDKPTPVKT